MLADSARPGSSGISAADEVYDVENSVSDDFTTGQFSMSNALIRRYGDKIMYVPGVGWFMWTGKRWREDTLGKVNELVKKTLRRENARAVELYVEAGKLAQQAEHSSDVQEQQRLHSLAERMTADADKLKKDATQCQSSYGVDSVLKLTRSVTRIAVTPLELNSNEYLINLRNGTLNIQTGEFRPPEPGDRNTKLANIQFHPNRYAAFELRNHAPKWHEHLTLVLPDAEVREYFQTVMGLSLIGAQPEHIFAILYGNGRNGKGACVIAVRQALGDYATEVARDLFTGRSDAHTTSQTDLMGARLAVVDEPEGGTLSESLVKGSTGGGIHKARKMKQDNIDFPRTWLTVMLTNNLPTVTGTDDGIWDRVKVIEFPHRFRDGQDKVALYGEEVLAREADGIFMWLYEGWQKYQKAGKTLTVPQLVKEATAKYRHDNDRFQRWLDSRCQLGSGDLFESKTVELLADYQLWRTRPENVRNAQDYGKKEFLNELRSRGYKYDSKKGRVVGLRLDPRRDVVTRHSGGENAL